MGGGAVPYRCSIHTRCDYQALRGDEGWLKPPTFSRPWSPPAAECVVERQAITFVEARAYFADPEADLMPDFKIPVP
jgi:hypothetical protein